MPKADLHMHLIGAARSETVLELAERNGHRLQGQTVARLQDARFGKDFEEFIRMFRDVKACFVTPEDFERLTLEVLEDAARDGVRYLEPRVNWQYGPGQDLTSGILDALTFARCQAERMLGVKVRWILDFPTWEAAPLGPRCLDFVVSHRYQGVVGVDAIRLDGFMHPEDVSALRHAAERGVHVLAHAGEVGGPEEVRFALEELRAERVGHGLGAAQDPEVLDRLSATGTPIEVCVTSNLVLHRIQRIEDHPILSFLSHGVPVVISSDDSGLFRSRLSQEYEQLHTRLRIPVADLLTSCRRGFACSFLEDEEKCALLECFDDWKMNVDRC